MSKRYISIVLVILVILGISIIPAYGTSATEKVNIVSEDSAVSDIISKLSGSVVGIIGKLKQSSSDYTSDGDNLVFGSGVIYKSNGYIVTNAHVVTDMESIVVVLTNGKAYSARLKAIDDQSDLALIKIDVGMLTPAVFGSISDVVVGKTVVAIGTPLSFSLRNSATKGMISGINRSTDGEYRFIQSDAAINGGNSGRAPGRYGRKGHRHKLCKICRIRSGRHELLHTHRYSQIRTCAVRKVWQGKKAVSWSDFHGRCGGKIWAAIHRRAYHIRGEKGQSCV